MYRFFIRVQIAAVFSLCLAWDRLNPEPDYAFYYEAEGNRQINNMPQNNNLELAENFTQFLQRRKGDDGRNSLDNYDKPKDRYAGNVWSKSEDNYNNRKQYTQSNELPKYRYDANDWSRFEEDDNKKLRTSSDSSIKSTGKYDNMEYDTIMFDYLITKSNTTIADTTSSNNNFNSTTPEREDTEEFQVMKLLEEPELDGVHRAMRRYASTRRPTIIQKRLQKEKIEMSIKPNDDFLSPQKMFKIDPPAELPLLKHIETSERSSTDTTKSFILNDLPNKIIDTSKKKNTSKHVNKLILNKTLNKPHVSKKVDDKKQKSITSNNKQSQRRDTKISSEINDAHTQKFEKIISRENQIIDILNRQTVLLEQVAKLLDVKEQEKEVVRTKVASKDFDNLLEEVDKKRGLLENGTNMTQGAVNYVKQKLKLMNQGESLSNTESVTQTTAKVMLPLVKTIIDETEVRKALKRDPHIQRILKLAKKKRTKYLEDAAKYFSL